MIHLIEIPYSGEFPAAMKAIAEILPPVEVPMHGATMRQQTFTASLVPPILYVQIPASEVDKVEEIEEAIASLPSPPPA